MAALRLALSSSGSAPPRDAAFTGVPWAAAAAWPGAARASVACCEGRESRSVPTAERRRDAADEVNWGVPSLKSLRGEEAAGVGREK